MSQPKEYKITPEEILTCGGQLCKLPPKYEGNFNKLLSSINKFRNIYGKGMVVTSGYRTPEHNKKIGGASRSNHCKILAVDIFDPNKNLAEYCLNNLNVLEECGLWIEDPKYTKNWVHFQVVPPRSKKRVFRP
jgi:hypothetical protein